MDSSRLRDRLDAMAAILDEVPVDGAGNPIWELPAFMDDDLAGESANDPLGRLVRSLVAEIVGHDV